MTIDIGIIGAGNRGRRHAEEYAAINDAQCVAVADIDGDAATDLAAAFDGATYEDYRTMLDEAALDAVSVCVHNNLHAPVTIAAAEAGCHVFCEKPMAATATDATRMADAIEGAGVQFGVQNVQLFDQATRAAKTLIDAGELGEPYYGRAVYSRRRGRPYIDGYGTPGFVSAASAGGGSIIDIGPYPIGRLLYLLGNAPVERVSGRTFDQTADQYDDALVGDSTVYRDRLDESGYDVEDCGIGTAHLSDGSVLAVRAAWHMYLPDEPSVVAGTQGGVQLDPFEYYTTTADYEATVSLDLDEFETRQGLLDSETGYGAERNIGQFRHWIETLTGAAEEPIPTGEIALNATYVMDGIYRSSLSGRELTAAEIEERSETTATGSN